MPDRIVRAGILTSDAVNQLSFAAEVFYRRLINVVDDYGRYDGRPEILRAVLYPLRLDRVSSSDIGKWILETEKAALVRRYHVEQKPFVEVVKFGQKIRSRSKWPDPPATDINCQQVQPVASVVVDVGESVVDSMSGKPDASPPAESPPTPKAQAREILDFLNAKAGRAYQPVDANLDLVVARLKEGATPAQCRQVIAKKAREWLGDEKMAEFLRPATLFNKTKFAQYVGELVP